MPKAPAQYEPIPDDAKEIPGCPGYWVTPDGRVYSEWVRVIEMRRDRSRARRLRQHDTPGGHKFTKVNGRAKGPTLVHRMVLLAFVGDPPRPDDDARHLNGNPSDNRLENLAWGTRSDNVQDAISHGTHAHGETHHNAKLTNAQVVEIRRRHADGERCVDLGTEYGVSQWTVFDIVGGRTRKQG